MNPTMTPEDEKPVAPVTRTAPAPAAREQPAPATDGIPALTVKNLCVHFGKNQVLKNVSIDIAARAVTGRR